MLKLLLFIKRMLLTGGMLLLPFLLLPLFVSASSYDSYRYVMPMEYDDIEISGKYIYYSRGGKWGRADLDGRVIDAGVYASLAEAKSRSGTVPETPLVPYKGDNGLSGYKNRDGEIVIQAIYDTVADRFENNAAIVQYKGKYGIISASGETLYGFVCDTLYKSDKNQYYAYTLNEKTGFINDKFKKLSDPFLKATLVYMHDGYVIYRAPGGKYGLASYDGKILSGAVWDYMRDFCEGLAAVGVNEDFYGINIRWGFIDKKGNTVIPVIYSSVNPVSLDFSDGLAGVCDDGSGYYIDKSGNKVITLPGDTYPHTGFSSGLAVVSKNLEKKYINKNGVVILEAAPGVKWYRAGEFHGDIAVVSSYFDTFTEGYAGVIRYLYNTPSSWALPEVTAAKKTGLVPDDLAGQYNVAITRAEYCCLAVRLIEVYSGRSITDIVKSVNSHIFKDTEDSSVLYAQALGIVEGRGGGIFDPNGKINRQEAAKILVNTYRTCAFLPVHTRPMPLYGDRAQIDLWAEEGIRYMGEWGVMIGIGNNLFAPKKDYTREQSVSTMIRLYNEMLVNRPKTVFISPEITVTEGPKTDRYAADPEFFVKMVLPADWEYNAETGVFTASGGRPAAELSDLTVYPGGVPDNKNDEGAGVYLLTSGEYLQMRLVFSPQVTLADAGRIYEGIAVYDRKRPAMAEDLDSYMYDVNRRAAEALGWFEMSTMTARSGIGDIIGRYAAGESPGAAAPVPASTVPQDGYREIGDSRIKTLSDLEAYLKTLFTVEKVESLLAGGMYRDIGGKLCGLDAARGSDITKGRSSAEFKRVGDGKIQYTVTVELLGEDLKSVAGYETHVFTHELVGSEWIWTKFYLYR